MSMRPLNAQAFVVIELSDAHDWPPAHVEHYRIPAEKRPTVLHTTRDAAEREALRLSQAHQGGFVVFQAVAQAVRVKVPTHTNLRGEVMYSQDQARLTQLDDGVPF